MSAWYVSEDMAASHGVLGRSEGAALRWPLKALSQIMTRLGPGHLIYADKLSSGLTAARESRAQNGDRGKLVPWLARLEWT